MFTHLNLGPSNSKKYNIFVQIELFYNELSLIEISYYQSFVWNQVPLRNQKFNQKTPTTPTTPQQNKQQNKQTKLYSYKKFICLSL